MGRIGYKRKKGRKDAAAAAVAAPTVDSAEAGASAEPLPAQQPLEPAAVAPGGAPAAALSDDGEAESQLESEAGTSKRPRNGAFVDRQRAAWEKLKVLDMCCANGVV